MGKFEDALEQLRAQQLEDESPLEILEGYAGSNLRKQAEKAPALEKENEDLRAENRKLKVGPKVTEALTKAGVDFEALRKAEKELIEGLEPDDDEPTEDWVAKVIGEYELPVREDFPPRPDGGEGEKEPNAAGVVRQAMRAPTGGSTLGSGIDLKVYNSWPEAKRLTFRKEHPEEHKKLRQGEVVTGISY